MHEKISLLYNKCFYSEFDQKNRSSIIRSINNLGDKLQKMKIGIIDADLIGRRRHRFPNLVCEKISAYWNDKGAETKLLLSYEEMKDYDEVYVSKVFTDTDCPQELYDEKWLKDNPHIHVGGTGFYFDKAPNLPDEIEHHMPNYHLYDEWIEGECLKAEAKHNELELKKPEVERKPFNKKNYLKQFREYREYSIGFLTRGCFRKCGFCVNKKYSHVFKHSPLEEFYDPTMKKICMLDDNFFGCPNWREMINQLIETGRPFKFKQGLDERLLTREMCEILFNCKYDGDFTFAFDNIADYDLIESKLKIIRDCKKSKKKSIKFYVLVGYESTDEIDIENAFKRISLLMKYKCLPYVMRYQNKNETPWKESEYRGMYVTLARWANQPNIFKKMSFREFCEANQLLHKNKKSLCSSMQSLVNFENKFPEIAMKYFDLKY